MAVMEAGACCSMVAGNHTSKSKLSVREEQDGGGLVTGNGSHFQLSVILQKLHCRTDVIIHTTEPFQLTDRYKQPNKTFRIDQILKCHGNDVLLLPSYMCKVFSIELAWAKIYNQDTSRFKKNLLNIYDIGVGLDIQNAVIPSVVGNQNPREAVLTQQMVMSYIAGQNYSCPIEVIPKNK
ncbi:hypothetical protein C0J52_13612 [Blattella germanica]|nr:hypothetical protein C0J52_13612 [Blattella germanica]